MKYLDSSFGWLSLHRGALHFLFSNSQAVIQGQVAMLLVLVLMVVSWVLYFLHGRGSLFILMKLMQVLLLLFLHKWIYEEFEPFVHVFRSMDIENFMVLILLV